VLDDGPALVVTGADHEAIVRALDRLDPVLPLDPVLGLDPLMRQRARCAAIARNARWKAGRTGSVALAAALCRGRDLCLAPVDVPLVTAGVFAALSQAWNAAGSPARGWLAPRHDGRFGHPLVIGRGLLEELAGFEPDQPLRDLRERAGPLLAVDVDDAAILDDFDSPADLRSLQGRFSA
jgi:CTP:molybdopterin cytidylyltransferase MocA